MRYSSRIESTEKGDEKGFDPNELLKGRNRHVLRARLEIGLRLSIAEWNVRSLQHFQ
jgi:hypothetical protein